MQFVVCLSHTFALWFCVQADRVSIEESMCVKSRDDPLKSCEVITVKISHNGKVSDEVKSVLADFQMLDFENNPCNNSADKINYNDGQEANPFVKISKYYGRKKNVFLFVSMLQDKEHLRKIEDIVDQKSDDAAKAEFF